MITTTSQRRRALCLFLLISLGLHSLTGLTIWRIGAALDTRTAPADDVPQFDIIDLVEPANRITPARAKFIGVADNATTTETVAAPRPPPKTVAPSTPSADSKRPQRAKSKAPAALPLAAPTQAASRRAPATALVSTPDGRAGGHVPEAYFRNFKKGAHTYVNVLRHPGVDFFVEMKRQLRTAWNPSSAIRSGLTEEIYRRGHIGVVIGVTVDAHGNLREKFILQPSGLSAYDQDALRTFAASAPFFAPAPADLALDGTADNLLHMSWSLVTYLR